MIRQERGSTLVMAVLVCATMLVMSVPILAQIESTQRRTTNDRVRETAYNLAEAALSAETLALTTSWPHSLSRLLPAQCTRASTDLRCPQPGVLARDFGASDFDAGSGWVVEVRDNLAQYDRGLLQTLGCGATPPCTWDSNRDGILWLRATATVRGRSRTLVAQVRQHLVRLPVPRNIITAQRMVTTNNGLKTIIDGKGCLAKIKPLNTCNSVQPAPVVVRCSTTTAATIGDNCLGYRPIQVAPNLFVQSSTAGDVLTPAQLDQVRAYAVQVGGYRNTCPVTAADMTGPMVFVEPAPGSPPLQCAIVGNGVANTAQAPGAFVINRGRISLGGTFDYHGIVYATNNLPEGTAGDLVKLTGDAYVQGGILVDGTGGVEVGASGLNVSFDENAFAGLTGVSGTPSIVQGSYRELPAGR